jgi:hypothetical protein
MTPNQQATRCGLLEALYQAKRALLAGPRGPRMTQQELYGIQRLQAERDKARLALDAFDDALGQPREEPGQ